MTREHKLALIVGFSLILLVGVLISDHLSRARQARIAQVAPTETRVADATVPPAPDPLRNLENLAPPPAPVTIGEAPARDQRAGSPADTASPNPATTTAMTNPPAASPADSLGEAIRTQPEPSARIAQAGHEALLQEIQSSGGSIGQDSKGNVIFSLPSAAGTTMASAKGGVHGTSTPGDRLATSPIAFEGTRAAPAATTENIRIHAVQKGETLFEIAAKYYGTGHVWRELAGYNGMKDKEGVVRAGMRLRIPDKDTLLGRVAASDSKTAPAAGTSKPQPKRPETVPLRSVRTELASYTVKKGESLGVIAQKTLGSSKRWQEIADLNKIEDEDHVPAGTVLKIPGKRG